MHPEMKTSCVHHPMSTTTRVPISPSLSHRRWIPLELKGEPLTQLLLRENQLHGAVMAKTFSLCPYGPIQAALSRYQGPAPSKVTPWEQGVEPRWNPRDQALHTAGQYLDALRGSLRGWSPRSEACTTSTPHPSAPEFREFTKHLTHRFVCGLLGCSFLFSHEVSLFVCLLVEDKAARARERAPFNSTKTQNSTRISAPDPDHQPSFFIGGVGGVVPISQINILRQRKMERFVHEQPPGTAEPRSGPSSTTLQCLSYRMPPG